MVQILDKGITRPLEFAAEKREGYIGTHDMSGPQKDCEAIFAIGIQVKHNLRYTPEN